MGIVRLVLTHNTHKPSFPPFLPIMSVVAVSAPIVAPTDCAAPAVAAVPSVPADVLAKQLSSISNHSSASALFRKAAHDSGNTDSNLTKEEMVRYAQFLKACMASTDLLLITTFTFAKSLTLWDMSETEMLHDWMRRKMSYFTPGLALGFRYSDDGKSVVATRSIKAVRSTEPVYSFGVMVIKPEKPRETDDIEELCAEIDDLISSADEDFGDDEEDQEEITTYFWYD